LKAEFKNLERTGFGNMVSHKKTLIEELCVLDGLEEVRALVTEEKLRKTLVISELEKSPKWRSWRQKSKVINA
jgi:hypothetical protein